MSIETGLVEVIIKLGGSAITYKDQFETENIVAIEKAAKIVARLRGKCVVVHGAGSFGHFQAHEYGTAKGLSPNLERARTGFAKTRLSVTKLNHKVTDFFVNQGIPAIGLSPCGSWATSAGHVTKADISQIKDLLVAGFVPVLHGDCVIDSKQGCAILSGDKIIEKLVQEFLPARVVFLTNVQGIFDKPPEEEGASLLNQISITKDGNISVPIATNTLGHDVTGGLRGKLQSATNIVTSSKGCTKVIVANIMSECGYRSCVDGCATVGEGTVIKLSSTKETIII